MVNLERRQMQDFLFSTTDNSNIVLVINITAVSQIIHSLIASNANNGMVTSY